MRLRWGYILSSLLLLVLWWLASILAGELIVPSPLIVFSLLLSEMGHPVFWAHLNASAVRILMALLIAFVSAVPLGLAIGSSSRVEKWTRPLIYMTYPVPKIVLLPVIFLLFGIGDQGKIAMLALILFFQLLIPARDAARDIETELKYSLYSLGGSRWDLFKHVILPASLPAIFTSLRIATGTVVAVLFFVESIGTRFGMGFYILDAWGRAYTPQMYVGMLVLAIMGVALYELFDLLERAICRWKPSER